MKRSNKQDFINKSKEIHGDKYDYSLVEYLNNKTNVNIICKIHGVFIQRPDNHINNGCPKCAIINKRFTKKQFINKSKEIHDDKYDYSLVEYLNNKTKVKIICPIHGIFNQTPKNHLNKQGCPFCKGNIKLNKNKFIKRSNKVHNYKYGYSLINYKNNKTKVKIICPVHGVFEQRPDDHIRGVGCNECKESYGEKNIKIFLENNNINFETQKTFNGCKYKKLLKFDFYLPDYNICIEFDGIQHYESINFFGCDIYLKTQIIRDNIKTEYCLNNNIKLLRIPYTDINMINDILQKILKLKINI